MILAATRARGNAANGIGEERPLPIPIPVGVARTRARFHATSLVNVGDDGSEIGLR